jgi:alanine racemase
VRVGDTAVVFGAGHDGEPTAETWADWAETIGDELVTGVMPRVPRVYVG